MKTIQAKRLAIACVAVAALVLAAPMSGVILKGEAEASPRASTDEGIRASDIIGSGDMQGALQRLEELAVASERPLPEFFQEEIGLLKGARDVRANGAGSVVGFMVDDTEDGTFESLRAHMLQKGWSEVSLGSVDGATFVKDGGACTWALVTCTQVGQATGVVFRCVAR